MSIYDLTADDLLAAVESAVLWHFEGAEEIGSSDISCAVRSVFRSLGLDPETEGPLAFQHVRGMVRDSIRDLLA